MNTKTSTAAAPVSFLPHALVSTRVALWSFMTGVAVALPALYLMLLLPLPAPTAEFSQLVAARKALVYLLPGAFFLKAVLIYPLIEEVFYRGIMFTMLRRYAPLWLAALVPTSLFALTHTASGLTNVGFAFIVGLYFCWLVVRSRSLLTSVLCHAAINLFIVFVFDPIMNARGLVARADMFGPLPLAMLACALALLVYGVRILRAEFNPRQPTREARVAPDVIVSAAA